MRITEAIAALATEYPMYSKSKLKTALKIEMQKIKDTLKDLGVEQPADYVVEEALKATRRIIAVGTLAVHGAPLYADPTGNEVAARESRTAAWMIANPSGSVATTGRTGLTAKEIEKIAAATKVAEKDAAPIRKFWGL